MKPAGDFRRVFAAVVALALVAVFGGCGKSGPAAGGGGGAALPKVRFKDDWFPQAEHGGFYEALAKGYYKDAGIDVEIVPGGPGPEVDQILLSGQVDLAMGRSDDVIVWDSNGLPFVIVGVYMERDPQAILVHDESPVRGFADLNKRTIMAEQSANWVEFIKARYHIDFQLIPLNFGIAQFMADKDFIQQCFVTNEPYYVMKNGGHPRTLLISDSGFSPYRVIYTTQRYAREHPAEVRAFLAASLKGWDDYMNGDPLPGQALILKSNENMTQEFLDYSTKAMRDHHIVLGKPEEGEGLGLMTRKRLQEQVDDLANLKLISGPVQIDAFARFDLLPPTLQAGAR